MSFPGLEASKKKILGIGTSLALVVGGLSVAGTKTYFSQRMLNETKVTLSEASHLAQKIEQVRRKKLDLEKQYEISIFFSKVIFSERIESNTLSISERLEALGSLEKALSKYPLNLSKYGKYYLLKDVRQYYEISGYSPGAEISTEDDKRDALVTTTESEEVGGIFTTDDERVLTYIINCQYPLDMYGFDAKKSTEAHVHHEKWHEFEKLYDDDTVRYAYCPSCPSKRYFEWSKINESGIRNYRYAYDRYEPYSRPIKNYQEAKQGFVREYARRKVSEDRSVVSELLLTDPVLLEQLAINDPILQRKIEYQKSEYERISHGEMDVEFFENLR